MTWNRPVNNDTSKAGVWYGTSKSFYRKTWRNFNFGRLRMIRAGGSPWPHTAALKRPEKEPPKKKQAAIMI